jgi:hypothetical protein
MELLMELLEVILGFVILILLIGFLDHLFWKEHLKIMKEHLSKEDSVEFLKYVDNGYPSKKLNVNPEPNEKTRNKNS